MGFLKAVLNFFLSLTTAIWLLMGLMFFLLYGAFAMPLTEEFQSINVLPLFLWLKQHPLSLTWWLIASQAILSALTINTMLCSVESIIKKRGKRQWLIMLSPQIIHLGFLFILFAHLMSSLGGFKGTQAAYEGSLLTLPNGIALRVNDITVALGPGGYPVDWQTGVEYLKGDIRLKEDFLGPNRPSFYKGLGIYQKDVRIYPFKAVLLEISREPGAPWALAGGILFMAGIIMLIGLSIRKER